MTIPPLKKSTFYTVLALVFLAGFVLGALLTAFIVYKNRAILGTIPASSQELQKAFDKALSGQPVSSSTIQRITSLSPNQTIMGEVVSVSTGQIVIQVKLLNLANPSSVTAFEVTVPVNKNDKIVRMEGTTGSTNLQAIETTITGVKKGDAISVKILADGSKVIYLPTIK